MATNPYTVGEQWEFRRERLNRRWRWRHRAREGNVVGASTESFASLRAAIEDATRNGFTYEVRWGFA